MALDAVMTEVPTRVRDGALQRHAVLVTTAVANSTLVVIASGLGAPRLWQRVANAAVAAFRDGVADAAHREADARLLEGLSFAREMIVTTKNALIERGPLDVELAALSINDRRVHVIGAGLDRAYVHRRGAPIRLLPKPADLEVRGAITATPHASTLALEEGDLVLLGTASAFTQRGVEILANRLKADPRTGPAPLVDALAAPTHEFGTGCALWIARVL